MLDALGVTVLKNHYYEPVITDRDIRTHPDLPRSLPGLDFNLAGQAELLANLVFADDCKALEGREVNGRAFRFANNMLGPGDAEAFYSLIRHLKPKTIVEVGAGNSTLVARLAISDIQAQDSSYCCRHICFEPYENPWLSNVGAEIRRERIEDADPYLFATLEANDIFFIDSSHVLRPQGDVETEFLRIVPSVAKGVYVHVHDVFTPRDYPERFLISQRRFWTEQYVLEAFLSFNSEFEIVLALNDLHKQGDPKLQAAFPVLASMTDKNPGSFWIRRRY